MQTTLVLLKPDSTQRSILGQIIARFEAKGLKIVGMKMIQLDDAIIEEHYDFLADKPFFPSIKAYMKSAPTVALALQGNEAISIVRALCGATNPAEANPGTIRGDFGMTIDGNIVHSSDSEETAAVELKRFFNEGDILSYGKIQDETL